MPTTNPSDELRDWHDSTLENGATLGVCYCRRDVGRYFKMKRLTGIGHPVVDRMIVRFVESITLDKIRYTYIGFPEGMRKVDGTPIALSEKKNSLALSLVYIGDWVESLPEDIQENIENYQIAYKTRRAAKIPF
jgi:hypothetical protein